MFQKEETQSNNNKNSPFSMIVLRAPSLSPHIRKDVEIAEAKKSHIQKFQIGVKITVLLQ